MMEQQKARSTTAVPRPHHTRKGKPCLLRSAFCVVHGGTSGPMQGTVPPPSFIQYLFAYPVHRYQYLPGLFTVTDAARIGKPENRAAYMVARAARPSPIQMYCVSSRNAGKAWYERGFVTSSPLLDLIARWTRDGRVRGSQEGCLLGSCCWYGSGGRRRRRSGRPGHAGHWCAREISRSLDLELGSRCAVCVFGLGLLFFFLSIGQ